MINLLCVLSQFNLYYGLPWKRLYFIKPKEIFLEDIFFLIYLVQVNKLIPVTNCLLRARSAKLAARPVNILPILKWVG